MTGKDLLEILDRLPLRIDIGAGDTVFYGYGDNGEYLLDFKLLDTPATPGETVDIKLCEDAKPYLSIAFSNIKSFEVFSEFVTQFYQLAQDVKSEENGGKNA